MKKILLIASVPVALMLFFAAAEVWNVPLMGITFSWLMLFIFSNICEPNRKAGRKKKKVKKVKFVHRFDEDRRINFDVTKLR